MLRATPGRDAGDCHVARGGRLRAVTKRWWAAMDRRGRCRAMLIAPRPSSTGSCRGCAGRSNGRPRGGPAGSSSAAWPTAFASSCSTGRMTIAGQFFTSRVPDPGHDRGVGGPGGQQPDRRGAQHAGRVPERTERRARRLFFRRLRNGRRPHRADLGDQSLARTHRAFAASGCCRGRGAAWPPPGAGWPWCCACAVAHRYSRAGRLPGRARRRPSPPRGHRQRDSRWPCSCPGSCSPGPSRRGAWYRAPCCSRS